MGAGSAVARSAEAKPNRLLQVVERAGIAPRASSDRSIVAAVTGEHDNSVTAALEVNDESSVSESEDSPDENASRDRSRTSSKSSWMSFTPVHPFAPPDDVRSIHILNMATLRRDSRNSVDSHPAASPSDFKSPAQDHMYEMLSKAIRHSGNLVQKSVIVRVLKEIESLSSACQEAPQPDKQMPQFEMKVDPDNLLEELTSHPFRNDTFYLQRVSCMGMKWVAIRLLGADHEQSIRFCLCASSLHNMGKGTSRSVVLEVLERLDGEVKMFCVACSPVASLKRHCVLWLNLAEDLSELAEIVLSSKDCKSKKVSSELKKWSQKQRYSIEGVPLTAPSQTGNFWSKISFRGSHSTSISTKCSEFSPRTGTDSGDEPESPSSASSSSGFLSTAMSYFQRMSSVPDMLNNLESQLASLGGVSPRFQQQSPRSPRIARSPRSESKGSSASGRASRRGSRTSADITKSSDKSRRKSKLTIDVGSNQDLQGSSGLESPSQRSLELQYVQHATWRARRNSAPEIGVEHNRFSDKEASGSAGPSDNSQAGGNEIETISMREFSGSLRNGLGGHAARLHAKALAISMSPKGGRRQSLSFTMNMPIVHEVQEEPDAQHSDDDAESCEESEGTSRVSPSASCENTTPSSSNSRSTSSPSWKNMIAVSSDSPWTSSPMTSFAAAASISDKATPTSRHKISWSEARGSSDMSQSTHMGMSAPPSPLSEPSSPETACMPMMTLGQPSARPFDFRRKSTGFFDNM